MQVFVQEKLALVDQRIATLLGLRERLANLPLGEACPLPQECVSPANNRLTIPGVYI